MNNIVSKDQRDFYHEHGYVVIRNVLSEDECLSLIKSAHDSVNDNITVISGIHRLSDAYLNLLKDPRILSLADSLLEWRMIPVGSIFFFSKANNPKESGSCPHQDNFAPKAPYGSYMACGVALDDADKENGSLIVYPGSHKLGEVPSDPKENFEYDENGNVTKALPIGNNCEIPKECEEKQLSYKRGDLIFFHAHLIHWAPKNVSNEPLKEFRRTAYLKFIKNGHPFWPGWTDKRELIERGDFQKGPVENNLYQDKE